MTHIAIHFNGLHEHTHTHTSGGHVFGSSSADRKLECGDRQEVAGLDRPASRRAQDGSPFSQQTKGDGDSDGGKSHRWRHFSKKANIRMMN